MAKAMRWTWLVLGAWLSVGPRLDAADPKLELVLQTGHTLEVNSVAMSGDGKYVLTGSLDGSAILWDAATGARVRSFKGHADSVRSVAMSEDGKHVFTTSDKTAVRWDAVTGAKLRSFGGALDITMVAMSGDGKHVLTGSNDHTAALWDAATGTRARSFKRHTNAVLSVALSGDGRRVLTGSADKTAVLWDGATGAQLLSFKGHTGEVHLVALSGDGKYVLTGSSDKTAVLWDAATGAQLRSFKGHTSYLNSVALSGDGKRVLTGSSDKPAVLWDAATGAQLRTFKGHKSPIFSAALSRDGKHVLTGSEDGTAVLWDGATGAQLRSFTGHTNPVLLVALSRDGEHLLTGCYPGTAVLWGPTLGAQIRSFKVHINGTGSLAMSADGKYVVTSTSEDKTAVLYATATGAQLRTFTGHTKGINSVAISGDGKYALTGSSDKTAVLWDAATGARVRAFTGHTDEVTSVALSADGKQVLTGSNFLDKTAVLWDAATGAKLRSFKGHTDLVGRVALSGDGKHVVTASLDNTAVLWDATTGAQLRSFKGHTAGVTSVALSRDGKHVLTSSNDNTAVLWSSATGAQLRSYKGHTHWVLSAAMSGDGKHAFTGSSDGTVALWDAATGSELCRLISLNGGADWLVVTPDGLWDGSVNAPRFLAYRVSGTLDFVPLDRYYHRYYTPGLLARLMKGERPKAKVDIARALPPTVRILTPATSVELKDGTLTVRAEAESRGEFPVIAFRLLVDGRPHEGVKALVKIADPKPGKAEATWKVELDPGRHTLKVLADTALVQGVPSEQVEVRYVGGDAKIELPRMFVLAIGISKHSDRTLNLDFAAKDAIAVAKAYEEHSKKLFRSFEAKVVTDEKATRRGILQGLLWLRENVKKGDYAVFFFAGHGEKNTDSALYFLPTEAEVKDLESSAISAAQLKDILTNIPGRLTAILDACHSGDIDAGKTRGPHGLTDDLARQLIAEQNGLVVLCATTGNEKAQESREHGHGMFTVALLEGLAGKAVAIREADGKARELRAQPNRDGVILLHQLESFLYERVENLSGGRQHPVVGKSASVPSFPVSRP